MATEWLESTDGGRERLRGIVRAARRAWGADDVPCGWIGGQVANALEGEHRGLVSLYDVLDHAVRLSGDDHDRGAVTDALGAWALAQVIR